MFIGNSRAAGPAPARIPSDRRTTLCPRLRVPILARRYPAVRHNPIPPLFAAAAGATLAAPAPAQVVITPVKATANATVQPAGPRAGSNGTAFFNVEGNANGANASFGTADFAPF